MLTIEERKFGTEITGKLGNIDKKLDKMANILERISENLNAIVEHPITNTK